MTTSAAGYLLAAILFVPPVLVSAIGLALPIYLLAAAALTAPSAPVDAAILDVIPPALWGRAEGVLTAVRTLAQALAPVAFGLLADVLGETHSHSFGQGTFTTNAHSGAQGLEVTILIMLVTLALAGVALMAGSRSYPRDTATALASEGAGGWPASRPRRGGSTRPWRGRISRRSVTSDR
jgi:hypothetical protein